jgi:predicted homoserine dehydrogenase-like protein
LLPLGLASYARLTRDISADQPIPLGAVTFEEENLVLALRRQQEAQRQNTAAPLPKAELVGARVG